MYASFRSVTAKNGKILTPTRTGNFLLTSMDPKFYATINREGAAVVSTITSCKYCLGLKVEATVEFEHRVKSQ